MQPRKARKQSTATDLLLFLWQYQNNAPNFQKCTQTPILHPLCTQATFQVETALPQSHRRAKIEPPARDLGATRRAV